MDQTSRKLGSFLVDASCFLSVVGIWPRFIEPFLLSTTHLHWKVPSPYSHLKGLKILQISDLHFHSEISKSFLKKISDRILNLRPDLLLFTGDFLCYSQMEGTENLKTFLKELDAPLGSFCIFGNHDYASYVSRNREGTYDVMKPIHPLVGLSKGIRSLFSKSPLKKGVTEGASKVPLNSPLCHLLQQTPFQLLENASIQLPVGLNLVGLGEYGLGRCRPDIAFKNYDTSLPGIVLTHNPDSWPQLFSYPGEVILSGHTHGEQIHFPFPRFMRSLSKKLTRVENPEFTRGVYQHNEKLLYVNRGLGCHKPIRFCSIPEVLVITVVGD